MLGQFLVLPDPVDDGLDQAFVVEGDVVEAVLVPTHALLEATRPAGFIDLDGLLLLLYFKEGADIVRLGQQQAVVAGTQTAVVLLQRRFYQHRGGRARVDRHVDRTVLKALVLLYQGVYLAL